MTTEAERGAALVAEIDRASFMIASPWCTVTFAELADMMAAPGPERLRFIRNGYPELTVSDGRVVKLFPAPRRPSGPILVVNGGTLP